MTGEEAMELMAPYMASIDAEVDRAPELRPEALELLKATGLGRYLPAPRIEAAS